MSNLLKMAMVQSILSLHAQGWSQRRIARQLGIDRETVRRDVQERSKPANAPIGSPGHETPMENPPAAGPGRLSDCQPWRHIVLAKLELGLSLTRIHQDLVTEHKSQLSYDSVRRFVKRLGQT